MKKLIVFTAAAFAVLLIYLAAAGGSVKTENNGVRYLSAQSSVLNEKDCLLCFENSADKALEFCVYGVFDGERIIGLDESGRLKKVVIQPNERKNFVFSFNRSEVTAPNDVAIVGEYK